ncbi:MAG: imidazoleglycerol-phosphate dehydratase HisB [Selenomonadaceae bacterium]|nr:imidazoleglycerol-phosphate dehydratase HisB [Selenomonadaceae bacterium]
MKNRRAKIHRKTRETEIIVAIGLDSQEPAADVSTGIGFFDHMLTTFTLHGHFDLEVTANGDIHVDGHHTIEDLGITMGLALKDAIGDKKGINRYGSFFLPMDEALAFVALDFSGRPYFVFEVEDKIQLAPMVGTFDTQLLEEFFRALAYNAGITLHMRLLAGKNTHHIIEALFKAFAHALRIAVAIDPTVKGVPSTKGVL